MIQIKDVSCMLVYLDYALLMKEKEHSVGLLQTSQCPLVNFQSADQTRMIREYNGDIVITVTSHQTHQLSVCHKFQVPGNFQISTLAKRVLLLVNEVQDYYGHQPPGLSPTIPHWCKWGWATLM